MVASVSTPNVTFATVPAARQNKSVENTGDKTVQTAKNTPAQQNTSAPRVKSFSTEDMQQQAQITKQGKEQDPVEKFLALGRQKGSANPFPAKETVQLDKDRINNQQVKSQRFKSAKVAGDVEATLKNAEEIQRAAQSTGDLTAQEQAIVSEAKRLVIQARFELEKEQREIVREKREEALKEAQAEAAEARRANTPSPFRELKTPFDKIEEVKPIVTLGTSINVSA